MALVSIENVNILNNPCRFNESFQLEITFEVLSELKEDLEFKLIYVGSATDENLDQVLDCVMVGPVPVGVNKFVFQTDGPNADLLDTNDVLGVTVILLVCSYLNREFIRIGYYVNNEYSEEELKENPPVAILFDKLQRSILADKPKVTRFPIQWDDSIVVEDIPVVEEEMLMNDD